MPTVLNILKKSKITNKVEIVNLLLIARALNYFN